MSDAPINGKVVVYESQDTFKNKYRIPATVFLNAKTSWEIYKALGDAGVKMKVAHSRRGWPSVHDYCQAPQRDGKNITAYGDIVGPWEIYRDAETQDTIIEQD